MPLLRASHQARCFACIISLITSTTFGMGIIIPLSHSGLPAFPETVLLVPTSGPLHFLLPLSDSLLLQASQSGPFLSTRSPLHVAPQTIAP